MGILDLFKRKKAPETISFEDVHHWLDQFVDRKKLNSRLDRFLEDFRKQAERLDEELSRLGQAGLVNPNIPEKAKQIMQGNRENYLRKMRGFLADIHLPKDPKDVGYFSSKLSEDITELGEDTQRAFFVLKEFFEEEMRRIASAVKGIEDLVIDFRRELDKEGLDTVNDTKMMLRQLSDDVKKRKEIIGEKKAAQTMLKELQAKEEKVHSKIEEIKEDSSYKKFQESYEKKQILEEKLDGLENELRRNFSSAERQLRKLAHGHPDKKLIERYISYPVESLLEDSELKIKNIVSGIEGLGPDWLEHMKDQVSSMREMTRNLKRGLQKNVTFLNLTEQEGFLKDARRKISEQEDLIQELESRMERLNIDLARQKIKEKVRELSDVRFSGEQ